MAKTTQLLYAATRPRGLSVAYGHAMSCTPTAVVRDSRMRLLAHIFGMHGISVPISRGSPPILE